MKLLFFVGLFVMLMIFSGCSSLNMTEVIDAMDRNNSVVHLRYRSTGLTWVAADPATASGSKLNVGTMHTELDRVGRDEYEQIEFESTEGTNMGLSGAEAGITASTRIETKGKNDGTQNTDIPDDPE